MACRPLNQKGFGLKIKEILREDPSSNFQIELAEQLEYH